MEAKQNRYYTLRLSAAKLGLDVATWNPGDGITRYRFQVKDTTSLLPPSYHKDDGIYTALGIKQAEVWLEGYCRGK